MIIGPRAGYDQILGCGLNLFTRDELNALHVATLDVLENGGIMVFTDEAQEIFYSHGCKVDKKTNIVKIPGYLVNEAIASAPSKLLLAGRNPKYDLFLEGTQVFNCVFGVGVKVLDLETGQTRESTLQDLAEAMKVSDAADAVDLILEPVTPRDVPSQVQAEYATEACLINSSKHFMHGEILTTEDVRRFYEMGVLVAGGKEEFRQRPVCSLGIGIVSPLQLGEEDCDVIIEAARLGIPCTMISMALSGATVPVTNAGTLVCHNAEVLGGITLSQLTKKGAPVIYGSSTTMFDLLAVTAPVGAPELAMINAAVAKLAQYYLLPSLVAGT